MEQNMPLLAGYWLNISKAISSYKHTRLKFNAAVRGRKAHKAMS